MKQLKRYLQEIFEIQGRLARGRYWILNLIAFLISIIAQIILIIVALGLYYILGKEIDNSAIENIANITDIIIFIPFMLATLALMYRRSHDVNLPFWLMIIPIFNIFYFVYISLKKGTIGPNKYGSDLLDKK